MELHEALELAKTRIAEDGPLYINGPEEETKTGLILPMLYEVLGVPQRRRVLRAEYGDCGQDKVDYAVQSGDDITLLIECKPLMSIGSPATHLPQLRKYFGFGGCHLICLTDGDRCCLFTDMRAKGKMDDMPCYELWLSDLSHDDMLLIANMRLHLMDRDALHDAVCEQSRRDFLARYLMEDPVARLKTLGFDMSSDERRESWASALESLCSPSADTIDVATDTKAVANIEAKLSILPADFALEDGTLYHVCPQRGQLPHPYDGFIWVPSGDDDMCYVLPGTRIRPHLNSAFHVANNKKTLLRRKIIELQGKGIATEAMPVETASGAGRIITGVDMWFEKVPKVQIEASEYYARFPEVYNPASRELHAEWEAEQ